MPPSSKLSPAFIATMLDPKRKASPPTATSSEYVVRPAAPSSSSGSPEPQFTPLEEILGERPASISAPVSAKPPEPQLSHVPSGPKPNPARASTSGPIGQVSKPSTDWRSFAVEPSGIGRPPNISAGFGLAPDQTYKIPSLIPKTPSFIPPLHGPQRTNAVAVGLKAANWGRSEVDGWNYTIFCPRRAGVFRRSVQPGYDLLGRSQRRGRLCEGLCVADDCRHA
jgi:hypothetical protein